MDDLSWEIVEPLFHEALALPAERRAEFLTQVCQGNEALYHKVSHLLSHYCGEQQFLQEVDIPGCFGESELEDAIFEEGQQFGRYKDIHLVGRGGMGEVYVANDSHLDRKVAIKILPKGFFAVPGDIERLRREAKFVSALAAPNIVIVYDFDEEEGIQFMVTEFVEGVSLRELIGRLSSAQAIRYAQQIGEALKAAHDRGIIHRDIKPENIMVRASDDCIKVLDFGLAKLAPEGPETGKSLYERLAESTAIDLSGLAGTVSYMSPEQVREQPLDARTDVWSWGVVLYEMLAGVRPFAAPTTREIFGAILHAKPNPPTEDVHLNCVVSKALDKDLAVRYASMAEALEDLARVPALTTQPDRSRGLKTPRNISRSRRRWLVLGGAVPIVAAIVFFGFISRIPSRPFQIGKMTRLTANGNVTQAAISPNGTYLAYATEEKRGKNSLKVLQVGTSAISSLLSVTGDSYAGITFSRDNRFIYYVLGVGSLHRVPLLGGEPELMIRSGVASPVSFSPDGKRFVFLRIDANDASLILHSLEDGKDETLFTLPIPLKRYFFRAPIWSPDGNFILCGVIDDSGSSRQVEIMSVPIGGGQSKVIGPEPWRWMYRPAWLKGGRSIAVAASSNQSEFYKIWEVSLTDGKATAITNDTLDYTDLDAPYDVPEIAAIQLQRSSSLGIVALNEPDSYREIAEPGRQLSWLAWTPSAKIVSRVAVGGSPEFWEIDPQVGKMRQLTFDGSAKTEAVISPDGQMLVYAAAVEGTLHLWRRRLDGRDQPARLTSAKSAEHQVAITPDGKWIIYTSSESGFQALWKVRITGGTPVQLTRHRARKAAISPDGKLIACEYIDDPQHDWSIVILDSETQKPLRSFPQIPAWDYALPVRWSRDGKSLLYAARDNSNIWIQPLNDSPPRQLTHFSSEQIFAFAPSPDGRFMACLRGLQRSDAVLAQAAK